jgi:hypothetical protein
VWSGSENADRDRSGASALTVVPPSFANSPIR